MQLKPGYGGDQQELRLEGWPDRRWAGVLRGPREQMQWTGSHPIKEKVLEQCNAFLLTPIQIRTSPGGMGVQGLDTGKTPSGARVRVGGGQQQKQEGIGMGRACLREGSPSSEAA